MKIAGFPFPTGNPTIVILICFFSGIQLLSLGVMAEYVGRIYDEVKRRPRFILESSHGIDRLNAPGARARDGGDGHRRVTPRRRSASSPAGSGRGWASGSATRRSR